MSHVSEHDEEVQPAKQEGGKERVTEKCKWEQKIINKLGIVRQADSEVLCIYKVPSKLRKVKEDAYNPRVVSIGPLHRRNPDLVAAMRDHKWRYMLSFLQQTDNPEDSAKCLKELTNAIYGEDDEVRECYAEKIKQKKNELTEIMLLDGCFILELFLRFYFHPGLNYKKLEDGPDPILKSAWMIVSLRQDLALLENQIPFFILEKFYDTILPLVRRKCEPPSSVATLALNFFQPRRTNKQIKEDQLVKIKFKHLLDLLHKFYFPAQADNDIKINLVESTFDNGRRYDASAVQQTSSSCHSEPDPKRTEKWGFNYCASELMESGIDFETNELAEDLLNISFTDPVLRIPPLLIDETTSSLFRNLIAYEQRSLGSTHVVTSYAFLMTSLIRSARDSKLLREKSIIQHRRIEDKEYLVQFQSILEEVVIKDDFYFGRVRDQVTDSCKSWCNLRKLQVFLRLKILRDMKLLYSTYFSSTWSFISFLAAVTLLFLACLQTYYTMNPRS